MPRDIPVGNGKLLLCFDENYSIRDLYFPHVGQENHLSGNPSRMGVWTGDRFSWVGPDWDRELRYREDSLATEVFLRSQPLQVTLACSEAVDFHENVFIREVRVRNLEPEEREVRLFFHLDLDISGNSVGDTATLDPKTGGIIHYKGARYFLLNGRVDGRDRPDQIAVGQKHSGGKLGTYKDAEDGHLSGNTIAQGSVDSVAGLSMQVPGSGEAVAWFWLAAGTSWEEVARLDGLVRHKGPEALIGRTTDYWRLWIHKEMRTLRDLPERVDGLYRRSLLVLNTQIDSEGGITAANDSDVIQFNRDTYSYVWPRDGALVANALDLAGYPMIAQKFYEFAARVISREGYFLHKYNPDGTLASSWHPWAMNGNEQLPIQEDETALVVWALWNHFVKYRDIEFIKPLYRPLVKKAAEFMSAYRDRETGLPAPSYDLWEERRGILSFTTGTVFGGLTAASLFCSVFGEDGPAERYRRAASEIRDAASLHLWRPELNRFCRMVHRNNGGGLEVDGELDASLWGLFAFGMYDAGDERMVSTMEALHAALWVKGPVGGMARYENDTYHRVSESHPGNPWFICTLWYADYLAATARTEEDLRKAFEILEWVAAHALPSGVLAEQVNPVDGRPLSVSPLTWSHATFVATTRGVMRRLGQYRVCPSCGVSHTGLSEDDWLSTLFRGTCDSIRGTCRLK